MFSNQPKKNYGFTFFVVHFKKRKMLVEFFLGNKKIILKIIVDISENKNVPSVKKRLMGNVVFHNLSRNLVVSELKIAQNRQKYIEK